VGDRWARCNVDELPEEFLLSGQDERLPWVLELILAKGPVSWYANSIGNVALAHLKNLRSAAICLVRCISNMQGQAIQTYEAALPNVRTRNHTCPLSAVYNSHVDRRRWPGRILRCACTVVDDVCGVHTWRLCAPLSRLSRGRRFCTDLGRWQG
jgi:hypothetical protein